MKLPFLWSSSSGNSVLMTKCLFVRAAARFACTSTYLSINDLSFKNTRMLQFVNRRERLEFDVWSLRTHSTHMLSLMN